MATIRRVMRPLLIQHTQLLNRLTSLSTHPTTPPRGTAHILTVLRNASLYSGIAIGCQSRLISNTRCVSSTSTSAIVETVDQEVLPLCSEKESRTVTDQINKELNPAGASSRLFAVIHAAGKQRKITVEDIIVLDKPIDADIGDRIRLNKVLLVGGKDFTVIGRPILSASQAVVEATVLEKTVSHGKIMFWYHRRENHRVFKLRKDQYTVLRINNIELSPIRTTTTTTSS